MKYTMKSLSWLLLDYAYWFLQGPLYILIFMIVLTLRQKPKELQWSFKVKAVIPQLKLLLTIGDRNHLIVSIISDKRSL